MARLINSRSSPTNRHYWWWSEKFKHGCHIKVGNKPLVIPMVDPKFGYTWKELLEQAEEWHTVNDGHQPIHTVIARVVTNEGIFVGIACLDEEPEKSNKFYWESKDI